MKKKISMKKKNSPVPTNSNPLMLSKTAFIKSFPSDSPAKDVVVAGKKRGISFSIAYVYSVRTAAKRAAKKGNDSPAEIVRRVNAKMGMVAGASSIPSTGPGSLQKKIEDANEVEQATEVLRAAASMVGLGEALRILGADRESVLARVGR